MFVAQNKESFSGTEKPLAKLRLCFLAKNEFCLASLRLSGRLDL
jgi:hypothetical protein